MIRYTTSTTEYVSKNKNFKITVKESDKPEIRDGLEVAPDTIDTFIDLRRKDSGAVHFDIKAEAIELKEFLEEFIAEWDKKIWNE